MTSSPSPNPPADDRSVPQPISARELMGRLGRGEAMQIVDVREEGELELARLSYPVLHLPLSRSAEWLASLESRLERDQPVAVLCHAGVRSWHFGCWLLQERGYPEVWNLLGGIDAWSVEVDPSVPRY